MPKNQAAVVKPENRGPRPFPIHTVEKALVVIQAIGDTNAGKPMDRLLVANAIGRTPSSSEFRNLLSSSLKYGFTEGTEKAEEITPTQLGLQVIRPQQEGEREAAIQLAVLRPELFARIFRHFDRNKMPTGAFFLNQLERTFGVAPEYAQDLATLVEENARFAGFMETISGSMYLRLPKPSGNALTSTNGNQNVQPSDAEGVTETVADLDNGAERQIPSRIDPALFDAAARAAGNPAPPKQIFLAHGKDLQSLAHVKAVLDQFKIPYKVAVDEPHDGRPISQKVATLMRQCSAAIFVFTKDEELTTSEGERVWRPSENVVYELGAAAVLYGTKIIIFKEDGIKFASDFQDLGYITFNRGEIGVKALDLLKELIAFDFIRVQPI